MSLFTIFMLVILLILLLAFVLYSKIVKLIAIFTNLAFFTGFIGLISVLFLSDLYYKMTNNYLQDQYLGQQLQHADSSINEVVTTKSNIEKSINKLLGREQDSEKEESRLYPTFVSLVSNSILLFIGIISLLLMVLGIYFKYSFVGYLAVNKSDLKLRRLEKEIKLLKNSS